MGESEEVRGVRGVRRRWWIAGGAAVFVIGALALLSLQVGEAGLRSSAVSGATLVEATGSETVEYTDGVISTPCFSYAPPDVGASWMLVAGTRGCATSIMPRGGDLLTQFHIRGFPGRGEVDELLRDAVDRAKSAGEPVDRAELVEIAGREVGVLTQTTFEGLQIATYLVPIAPLAQHGGAPIGVVNIGSLVGAWHDDVVTRIIGSLSTPAAQPADVGGGS